MARAAHVPTEAKRKQVEAMASYGIPQPDIAKVLGISAPTLRKYYEETLAGAETKANALVAQNLFNIAVGKGPRAVTAAIFWLKTRAGWKETSQVEHMGKDGAPIEHAGTFKIEFVKAPSQNEHKHPASGGI